MRRSILVGLSVLALVLGACGDDDEGATGGTDTEIEPESEAGPESSTTTTSSITTSSTTTSSTTTAPADVCSVVTADMVTAVLGSSASGTPTANGGCVWKSSDGSVLAAAQVPSASIPEDSDAADIFPMFGVPATGYRQTTVSRSTRGDEMALVVVGLMQPPTGDPQALSDAIGAVADALMR